MTKQEDNEIYLKTFEIIRPLKTEERESLLSYSQIRRYKRRQFVVERGNICRYYYFVIKGCLRLYYVDDKGNEHNLLFAIEGQWISDLESIHSKEDSKLFIDAVEDTEVVYIEHTQLCELWNKYQIFDRYFRVITEDGYVELLKRITINNSSSGYERYRLFSNVYPHLVGRLSGIQIASYLGITPEFLSKIKSQHQKEKKEALK